MQNAHILKLQGVENFRDLGGYSTGNGAEVKWGRLFRSGHMNNLSKFDCEQLASLNITALFDLRTPIERETFPTRWHNKRAPKIFTIDLHPRDVNPAVDLFDQIMEGRISRREVVEHMIEDYARMPFEFAPMLQDIIQRLLQPERGTLVIHCTAGKDRTGCAVALILSLLGVPWNRVLEDYLLSNQGFGAEQKLAHIADKFRRKVDDIDSRIDALRPLVRVEREYLETAFSAIKTEMDSLESYFESILEIEKDQIEQLQGTLLRS